MSQPLVSIIIVNFNGSEFLDDLFGSLHTQTYTNWEVIFVDNHSSDDSIQHLHVLSEKYAFDTQLKIVQLPTNTGFAMGNAKGIELAVGKYLLFLNTDVSMDSSALANMVKVMESQPQLAGVNPKVYLSKFLPTKIFDNIGICLDKNCSPYNRGIGQIDLGQYDTSEDILGVCFACCLVDTAIYRSSGGLDTTYFAYFEDVDWNIRTRKMGYDFLSAPRAIAYHHHSGTSSKNNYAWKFELIFKNYLRTVTKSLGLKSSFDVVVRKLFDLTKLAFRRSTDQMIRLACAKVVFNYVIHDWWYYILQRRKAHQYFIPSITDQQLFSYSLNEPSNFFDEVNYTPIVDMKMYQHIFEKKFVHSAKELKQWKMLYKQYFCSKYTNLWEKEFGDFLKLNQLNSNNSFPQIQPPCNFPQT